MFRPEPLDLVIIMIIGLLLFGANRLPETARAIGKAMREFRDAVSGKDETTSQARDTASSKEQTKPDETNHSTRDARRDSA